MKMLPFWLPRPRFRRLRHRKMRSASRIRPTTAPITIPAIAPPERPLLAAPVAGAAVLDGDEVDVGTAVLNDTEGKMVGSTTFAHLLAMFEL